MSKIIELEMELGKIKEKISYLSSHTKVKSPNHWATKLIDQLESDIYKLSNRLTKMQFKIDYQENELKNIGEW